MYLFYIDQHRFLSEKGEFADEYLSSFRSETWEKKPILVQRKNSDYYKGLFSTAEFDRMLRKVRIWNVTSSIFLICSIFTPDVGIGWLRYHPESYCLC